MPNGNTEIHALDKLLVLATTPSDLEGVYAALGLDLPETTEFREASDTSRFNRRHRPAQTPSQYNSKRASENASLTILDRFIYQPAPVAKPFYSLDEDDH